MMVTHAMESKDRRAWILTVDGRHAVRVSKAKAATIVEACPLAFRAVLTQPNPKPSRPWYVVR